MAKTYRHSLLRKLVNRVIETLLRFGLIPQPTYLLTVQGRRSGRPYSTPVMLVESERERWLVAPYGEVNWVHNARAVREVTLSRGRRSETLPIEEVSPEEGAPILRRYLRQAPLVRPYFDVTPTSPREAFVVEGRRHPVFRLREPQPNRSRHS